MVYREGQVQRVTETKLPAERGRPLCHPAHGQHAALRGRNDGSEPVDAMLAQVGQRGCSSLEDIGRCFAGVDCGGQLGPLSSHVHQAQPIGLVEDGNEQSIADLQHQPDVNAGQWHDRIVLPDAIGLGESRKASASARSRKSVRLGD